MQYAYLLIERVPTARITMPDGTVVDHPEDRADDAVRAWWKEHVRDAPGPDEGEVTAWEEALDRYRAATRIEQVEGTRGFSTEIVPITRITYPDGATDERALGGPPDERIKRRFSAQHPPPAGAGPRSDQYDAWRRLADVQITRATGWRSAFVHSGRREDFDLGARGWDFGLPIVEIVTKLDSLAADGWNVLDVAEDHGIYHGPHARTDHFVTRARYLLGREAP